MPKPTTPPETREDIFKSILKPVIISHNDGIIAVGRVIAPHHYAKWEVGSIIRYSAFNRTFSVYKEPAKNDTCGWDDHCWASVQDLILTRSIEWADGCAPEDALHQFSHASQSEAPSEISLNSIMTTLWNPWMELQYNQLKYGNCHIPSQYTMRRIQAADAPTQVSHANDSFDEWGCGTERGWPDPSREEPIINLFDHGQHWNDHFAVKSTTKDESEDGSDSVCGDNYHSKVEAQKTKTAKLQKDACLENCWSFTATDVSDSESDDDDGSESEDSVSVASTNKATAESPTKVKGVSKPGKVQPFAYEQYKRKSAQDSDKEKTLCKNFVEQMQEMYEQEMVSEQYLSQIPKISPASQTREKSKAQPNIESRLAEMEQLLTQSKESSQKVLDTIQEISERSKGQSTQPSQFMHQIHTSHNGMPTSQTTMAGLPGVSSRTVFSGNPVFPSPPGFSSSFPGFPPNFPGFPPSLPGFGGFSGMMNPPVVPNGAGGPLANSTWSSSAPIDVPLAIPSPENHFRDVQTTVLQGRLREMKSRLEQAQKELEASKAVAKNLEDSRAADERISPSRGGKGNLCVHGFSIPDCCDPDESGILTPESESSVNDSDAIEALNRSLIDQMPPTAPAQSKGKEKVDPKVGIHADKAAWDICELKNLASSVGLKTFGDERNAILQDRLAKLKKEPVPTVVVSKTEPKPQKSMPKNREGDDTTVRLRALAVAVDEHFKSFQSNLEKATYDTLVSAKNELSHGMNLLYRDLRDIEAYFGHCTPWDVENYIWQIRQHCDAIHKLMFGPNRTTELFSKRLEQHLIDYNVIEQLCYDIKALCETLEWPSKHVEAASKNNGKPKAHLQMPHSHATSDSPEFPLQKYTSDASKRNVPALLEFESRWARPQYGGRYAPAVR
ncbi:hypothetical protein BT63DRAFT_469868 [Microthyrium microscopicum]|uniref:Uncharacterized protein n=1 Tax=Microthyrium microscopicum TaxID=703497 RepID=A0A6A6UDA5_9PEZI|nr:hypothetical protein BT63DRAFT_469868 [Microthyrium microscopicum]